MVDGAIDSAGVASAIEPLLAYVAPAPSGGGAFEQALNDASRATATRERRAETPRDEDRDDRRREDDSTPNAPVDRAPAPAAHAEAKPAAKHERTGEQNSIENHQDATPAHEACATMARAPAAKPGDATEVKQRRDPRPVDATAEKHVEVKAAEVKPVEAPHEENAEVVETAEATAEPIALGSAPDSLATLTAAVEEAKAKGKSKNDGEESEDGKKKQREAFRAALHSAAITDNAAKSIAEEEAGQSNVKDDARNIASGEKREVGSKTNRRSGAAQQASDTPATIQAQAKERADAPSPSDAPSPVSVDAAKPVDPANTPPTPRVDTTAVPSVSDAAPKPTANQPPEPRGRHDRFSHNAAGAGREAGTSGETEVQRVRLVQRVARAFQRLGNDGGDLRLRLSPPSLGALKLEVTVRAGEMSARIEAETPAAKAMIVDNLPALRERLSTHDIKLMHFDVELAPDSQRHPQNPAGQEQSSSPRGRSLGRESTAGSGAAATDAPRRSAPGASGKLDVLI